MSDLNNSAIFPLGGENTAYAQYFVVFYTYHTILSSIFTFSCPNPLAYTFKFF